MHTAANRSVLLSVFALVAKAYSPARNPASRFGYEGLGGPISAGAAHSFNGIAPSTPCARLTSAIAQQAQQMCGVLPDHELAAFFSPYGHTHRKVLRLFRSAKLKQTFDFSAMRPFVISRAVAFEPHNAPRGATHSRRAKPSKTQHPMPKSPAEKSSIPKSLSKPRSR